MAAEDERIRMLDREPMTKDVLPSACVSIALLV